MSFLDDVLRSAQREFDAGDPDTNRKVMFEARKRRGESEVAPRSTSMRQSYRTPQAINVALGGKQDPDFKAARATENISFDVTTPGKRLGTVLGALGADIAQDSLRSFWWLINAPQAATDIAAEALLSKNRPDLYQVDPKTKKPKFGRGAKALMTLPAGVAVNAGLGLMTPFGGGEGYKALMPSEDDPSVSANPVMEVAGKYILGRTGGLLPYDEFVKVRPDVSPSEYKSYKAYLFDKGVDVNPFDGDFNVGGVLKGTTEGIHGAELQFLGKSMPVNQTLVPTASAIIGAAAGARFGGGKPVRRAFYGGAAGGIAGGVAGHIIENERRRRNTVENELGGTL